MKYISLALVVMVLGGCAPRRLIYLEGRADAYKEMWEQEALWKRAYKAALDSCHEAKP